MSGTLRWPLLCIFAFAATAFACLQPDAARPPPEMTSRERLEKLQSRMRQEREPAKAREAAIKNELKAIPDDEWAGIYSTGGGLSGLTLSVAPKEGFVFRHWSDIGDHDLNHGTVKEALPDRILFDCIVDPKFNEARFFSGTMYRVAWGKRRYLVSEKGMVEFCNRYNEGDLSRGHSPFVMIRRGDEQAATEGTPSVPEPFKKYLLAAPITTTIRSVNPVRRGDMPEGMKMDVITAEVTLPVGTKAGVLPGMAFYVTEPQSFVHGTVTAVRDDECTVEFKDFLADGAKGIDPKPGWKLSTRHWISEITKPDPAAK